MEGEEYHDFDLAADLDGHSVTNMNPVFQNGTLQSYNLPAPASDGHQHVDSEVSFGHAGDATVGGSEECGDRFCDDLDGTEVQGGKSEETEEENVKVVTERERAELKSANKIKKKKKILAEKCEEQVVLETEPLQRMEKKTEQ